MIVEFQTGAFETQFDFVKPCGESRMWFFPSTFWDFVNFYLFLYYFFFNICSPNSLIDSKFVITKFFSNFYDWLTLKVNESRMWSFPSLSFNFLRSSAKGESGSTLMIFTFHSYRESFTSSTWNIINKLVNLGTLILIWAA